MAGLLNRETNSALPLRASSVWTDVRGFTARTTATLTYYNDHRLEIEGLFIFPLEFASRVVEFEANIEGRYVFVDVYNENSIEKKSGIFDDEIRCDEIFSICIGRLSPWILIDIQMTIITEIKWLPDTMCLKLMLPSVFTPRISSASSKYEEPKSKSPNSQFPIELHAISTLGYSLQIEVNVEAPCLLAGISSDTFPIKIDAIPQDDDASKIRVSLSDDFKHCDKDFRLSMYLSKPREPFIYIEQANHTHTNEVAEKNPISNIMNNPVIMLSYCPDISNITKEESGFSSEFIFMIDRSGSMNGNLINNAKETILLFLHSLPTNSYFNVISFGTYFQSLFKESQPYSQINLEDACSHVRKLRADMGGTSLLEPLEWILNRPLRKAVPRQLFILTDGMVTDCHKVIECVQGNEHFSRIFAFGLGNNICPSFLEQLADATKGRAVLIPEGERIQPKVIEQVVTALKPAITNLRVSWILPDGYDVIYTPEHMTPLFDGDRLTLYAILAKRNDLETTSNGRRSQRTSTDSVKEFWFEEDEFDVELIYDETSNKDNSQSSVSDSDLSHGSLVCNKTEQDEMRLCPEADDCNDSEVFLTEEEAERISEAYKWQDRKRSSIDRVQSWKVSRNPDSIDSENSLGVAMYENQWKSAERLLPRSKSYGDNRELNMSSSTGDVRRDYSNMKELVGGFALGSSADHSTDSMQKYLAHPGYPTRHNSARSNEGRSPIQKTCTENEMFSEGFCHESAELTTDRFDAGEIVEERGEKRFDATTRYPKSAVTAEEDRADLRECNFNTLKKEARRLKQSLTDEHVNTHFIDESNIQLICKMLDVLVMEKRCRLTDYILHQEEFVKCSWDKEYEQYKQCLMEYSNRRDSGLGNRSSSEPKSDLEEDLLPQCNRLEPSRGNGLYSVSSSGYFECEKLNEDKHMNNPRTNLYRRQISDECRSEKSGRSGKSVGRTRSSSDNDTHGTGNVDAHNGRMSSQTKSINSDCTSAKSYRTSNTQKDMIAEKPQIECRQSNATRRGEILSASCENVSDKKDSLFHSKSIGELQMRSRTGGSTSSVVEKNNCTSKSIGSKESGSRSVLSSFIDGVKNLANKLSEKTTDVSNEKQSGAKKTLQGIFSRQSTADKKDAKNTNEEASLKQDLVPKNSRSSTLRSEKENKDQFPHQKRTLKTVSRHLSKDISVDKSIENEPVKRQSSMRYKKPILERSRTISISMMHDHERSCTISTSVMHDLGDGEEINGDNITLGPNQGIIYLSGLIGRRIFKRLIPFKMAVTSENDAGSFKEPTIHQLAAKSIICDLEQQLEDSSLDTDGKEYIIKLIGQVSRSARISSKHTSLVAIDDKCKEGQVLCIKKYSKNKGKTYGQKNSPNTPTDPHATSPPLYEIERQEVKQIEAGNKTQKIMTTKFLLFTPKPRNDTQALLSPISTSRHTLMVQKRLFDSSGYMKMVDIQSSDGFWNLNVDFAEALPAPVAKLKQSCPFVEVSLEIGCDNNQSKNIEISETNDKIWATSLALNWLCRLWSQYEEEWALVAQKSQYWLKSQRMPTGFELTDIKLMAQQSLGVLISSSRRASCH